MNRNTWREINLLARAHLELQRPRVGFALRIHKLEESELLRAGLVVAMKSEVINEKTGIKSRAVEYKPVDTTEKGKKEIKTFLEQLRENNQIHHILKVHEKRLKKQEERERSQDADSPQNNGGEFLARHDATTLARTRCNPVAPSGTGSRYSLICNFPSPSVARTLEHANQGVDEFR